MGSNFCQKQNKLASISLVYTNKTAIFLASGSVQQNYRFFTIFIFSGGKGNDNGSRQLAVGSWQRKSEIKGQRSEVRGRKIIET